MKIEFAEYEKQLLWVGLNHSTKLLSSRNAKRKMARLKNKFTPAAVVVNVTGGQKLVLMYVAEQLQKVVDNAKDQQTIGIILTKLKGE